MATYYQLTWPKPQESDGDGNPYSGGKVYFYEAGTSTPLEVYKTADGTAHDSPIVLDTAGRIPDASGVFMPADAFKMVLTDANDVEIYSVDNLVSGGAAGAITFAQLQDMSANTVLGSVAGGTPEEITMTAAGRALMDDATAAAQLVTLGITATAAEINWSGGTTSSVQDQLDVLTAAVASGIYTHLYGQIAANGDINKGSADFTVSKGATGYYTINFDTEITDDYVVTLTAGPSGSAAWGWEAHITANSTTSFTVYLGDSETGSPRNDVWNFILVTASS